MITNMSNITGVVELFQYTNQSADSLFGIMLVITVFVITFMALTVFLRQRAITAAMFISTITSVLLSILGVFPGSLISVMVILTGISAVFLFLE